VRSSLRDRLYIIIFKSDTPAGKLFDVVLIGAIVASVVAVMLETMEAVRVDYAAELYALEWGFTILFSIEYGLRLY